MSFQSLTASNVVYGLGWTLLHSLWQFALVSFLLFVALKALRGAASNIRYVICLIALAFSVALSAATFVQFSRAENPGGTPYGSAAEKAQHRISANGNAQLVFSDVDQPIVGTERPNPASSLFNEIFARLARRIPETFPYAVTVWLLGVAFFSFRVGGGLLHLRRLTSEKGAALEPEWLATFRSLCEKLGIEREVNLVSSETLETPIAVGFLRPMILVPTGLFLQMDPRQLELIIAHELIHIRRCDTLFNIAQSIAETVFFYHPAIWWMSAQACREREFAADDSVVRCYEDSHVTYAKALANLEEIRVAANNQTPRLAAAANGGNLMQRIQKILKLKTEENSANSAWSAGVALLFASAVLLTLFSVNSSSYVNADSRPGGRKLAIGFVSIPPLNRTENPIKDAAATSRKLIHSLRKYDVPAIGFLHGGMISDGEKLLPGRAEVARIWLDAGFEVGLGGFRHIWLYNTPVDDYIANIEKNERVAKQLIGDMGLPPRYFSYPYLNTGRSAEDRAKVEGWLASRGYTPVKYTFDNSEWMYSFAYDTARNARDANAMKEIRDAYLAYMTRMFEHYEAYSMELFGRDIPQTLVLTPSALTADTADEFFETARKRGYEFVSIDAAQQDPSYKTRESFYGEAGISWFERWKMARGEKLRGEPEVDSNIQAIWNEQKARSK